MLVGLKPQHLGNVIASIDSPERSLGPAKASMQLGFGQQIECVSTLTDDDYTTDRQQVKRAFERSLRPPRAFRQCRHATEITRQQSDDKTRFAEFRRANDKGSRLLGRHSSPNSPNDASNSLISAAACWSPCLRASSIPVRK